MTFDNLRAAEDKAANAMLSFVKSNRRAPSDEEKKTVLNALRLAGSPKYWRIEALQILRYCITSTSRPELKKIEVAIISIVYATEEWRLFGRLIAPQVGSNGDEPYKCGATIFCHLEDKAGVIAP
ncbi:MAG: hypothetical protein HDQ88_01735 [Clostridia bacterium]|nr:hypothetical protein [Clostridia bacterium]